jgi:cyclopropane fatty-acyl-phospholipid synthase-like methyltransferase
MPQHMELHFPVSEAAERNKGPILRIITQEFANTRRVLEVGSGTGQHARYFAEQLPHLSWQPSDTGEYVAPLRERLSGVGVTNLQPLIELDVRNHPWPVESVDGVFSANTLHIMSWDAAREFFRGVGNALMTPGVLCVYGPFRYGGNYTSDSNAQFDQYLQSRYPGGGIKDFEAVDEEARRQGLRLTADHAMPANNQLLVWWRPGR